MNLNNIQLTPNLLADLYASVLVETHATAMPDSAEKPAPVNTTVEIKPAVSEEINNPETVEEMAAPAAVNFKALGANAKNILIIVNKTDAVYLPDNELNFLTQVLSACKLSLADVAITNLQHLGTTDYKLITGHFNSKPVLLFDIDPLQLNMPLSFPQFQVQRYDGRIYLHAPDLTTIQNDVALKKELWNSLKTLFAL